MEIEEILSKDLPKLQEVGIGQAINNATGNLLNQAGSALSSIGQVGNTALQSLGQKGVDFLKNKQNKGIADKLYKAIEPVEKALSAYITYLQNAMTTENTTQTQEVKQ